MSQKPKMLTSLIPGNIGLISLPDSMFLAMTWDPASPKPIARSPPIFYSVFSSTLVSLTAFFLSRPALIFPYSASPKSSLSLNSCNKTLSSSSCAAFKGSEVIFYIIIIICSIGIITKFVTYEENAIDEKASKNITTKVVIIPKIAYSFTNGRKS